MIEDYLRFEREKGVSEVAVRKFRRFVSALFEFMGDREITKQELNAFRENLEKQGYSKETRMNYAKGVNRYLKFVGRKDLCYTQGKPKDIAGQRFGRLIAIEPTDLRERNDIVWRCKCDCGNEVFLPATRLLMGNTVSCGCKRSENIRRVNKYFGETSLRMSLDDTKESKRASSGYKGVSKKRGKWRAYINYKGVRYDLGSYDRIEDAVQARAQAKQRVIEDARRLLEQYDTTNDL